VTIALSKDLIGVKQSVVDEMILLNPYQIPILSRIGFGMECVNTKHEWNEDILQAMKDTITGGINDSVTTVPVTNGKLFRVDQVVRIADEYMLVTAVSGNNLTVTRGLAGTTATAALSGAEIEIMFNNKLEGSDARDSKYIPRTNIDNYTQIFDDTVKISGTAQAVSQYGIADLYLNERMKVQERLMLEVEKAIVSGIKYNQSDRRMMGGIRQYIKSNVQNAAAADLTWDMINTSMKQIYEAGGMKEATRHILLASAIQKTKITKLNKDLVRTSPSETRAGSTVTTIITDFGEIEVVTDINLRSDEIILTDLNRMQVKPLRGRSFAHTYLGTKGDYVEGQVVGEYTLEFKQEPAHALIKGLKIN
jgi:hypothetical protein